MAIGDRPYVGSWQIGKQTIVKHTPDARVLINGETEFAVCATCNKKTDFNRYITSVSVDPSIDPVSSATISLVVPRHNADVFSHDGNYVLQPGLEVVIQMRGYFPVTGYAAKGQSAPENDADKVPVYPYYQVFRGVVTEVSHEFSGGFYTASMSCSNILYFWQYLYLSTNGSVFGSKPQGSGIGVDLTGHRFTGASPYSIIYTLMRVGFGAAFGVNWTINQATNIAAKDSTTGESLYKHAALWWEKRWQESSMRLRMYGFDGSLFNGFEQSYLGLFSGDSGSTILKSFGIKHPNDRNFDYGRARLNAARAVGYRGTETNAAVVDGKGYTLNAAKMQAFTLDLGRLGSVNFFETEYMSKLEIANAAKEITGFEFYQDVDGDIVFKPPFYNLDTSDDPVYCIEDRDLISISESEREPEATYVKGSGSLFPNFTGILSGEFGTREGKFVDWRLVAKYGWRETSFESHYYSGAKQMFLGAIMRLDVANMEMRSASVTIPLRPELRPGYPVYIRHLDCFYYIKSMSHSFAPGGACQTTLTLCAKRAKWLPPGLPSRAEGSLPSLKDVHLDQPGEYPPMPLYVFPEDVEGSSGGSSGPPRIIGYPNVVLALDPHKINPRAIPGLPALTADTLLDVSLALGVLRRNPDDPANSYLLSTSNDDTGAKVIQKTELVTAYTSVLETLKTNQSADEVIQTISRQNPELGAILNGVLQSDLSDIEADENLSRYMSLQRSLKSVFGVGKNVPDGEYRYYSSSAPDEKDQAPGEYLFDQEFGRQSIEPTGSPTDSPNEVTVLRQVGDRVKVMKGMPRVGFRVYGLSAPDDDGSSQYVTVTTRDIRFLNFTRYGVRVPVVVQSVGTSSASAFLLNLKQMTPVIQSEMEAYANPGVRSDPNQPVDVLFGADEGEGTNGYGGVYASLRTYASALGVSGDPKVEPLITRLSIFTNAFTPFKKGGRDLPKTGTLKEVTAATNTAGVSKLAEKLAQSLSGLLGVIQSVYVDRLNASGVGPDPRAISARSVFLQSFIGYKDAGGDGATFASTRYEEKGSYTAVLPVSDNRGYEVYGTMAYGRGLGIKSYLGVQETAGSPTTSESMLATETFFALLATNNGEVVKALQAMPADMKAELAASLNTDISGLQERVESLADKSESEILFIRNTPVSSRSRGMSNTDLVSASELADLTSDGGTVCLCKGVEATHFLQAFTGQFVELTGDEAVNDFLTREAVAAGESYSLTKQALAGQVLDTRFTNGPTQLVNRELGTFQSGVSSAVGEYEQARAELNAARRNVSNSFNGGGS